MNGEVLISLTVTAGVNPGYAVAGTGSNSQLTRIGRRMFTSGYFWTGVGAFAAALIVGILALRWYMFAVPGRSHQGPLPAMTEDERALATRLRAHVVAIASTPHNVQHCEDLEKAATYIERELRALGHAPNRQAFETDGCDVRNIDVLIPARGGRARSTLVIGAHYDSAGDAPGANDNGSGAAAVLELARLLAEFRPAETSLRLAFFVNEEPPYFRTEHMGSVRYADLLRERGETVSGMMSLETIGWFSDAPGSQVYPDPLKGLFPTTANFIAFVAMPGSRAFLHKIIGSFRSHTRFPTIGGVAPDAISGIGLSDHWAFARVGAPAIMVTDTAFFRYPHYHRATDTPDKVDYDSLARIAMGLARVVREIASGG